MRFSYAESMIDPSFYPPLARAAEEAAYDSMVVPDSICYPRHATSRYPFSPDGTREFLEDKPFLEPFSLIPALGAVTSRLRFVTFVLKLPVRDPVLVAKQATSTAVLTGGRLVLGVGTSPWREDYEVLGVDWATRGRRMDESIAILRGLAAGGYFEHHGKVFDLPPVKIAPVPGDPIPVLIGGHADAALRRAARVGDGWMHGGGDPAELPALLERLARFRREEGTAGRPFQIHVISADAYTPDGVRRLEDQGVTDLIVGFRWPYVTTPDTEPLQAKIDSLRRYADTVITKSRSLSRTPHAACFRNLHRPPARSPPAPAPRAPAPPAEPHPHLGSLQHHQSHGSQTTGKFYASGSFWWAIVHHIFPNAKIFPNIWLLNWVRVIPGARGSRVRGRTRCSGLPTANTRPADGRPRVP
jgi:probable F420-dependent oxidoreductase